jgi:hypothetical protein
MTTHHNQTGEPWRLPDISRLDRARFVKEARRLRAKQIDCLLQALVRSFARPFKRADWSRANVRVPGGNVG